MTIPLGNLKKYTEQTKWLRNLSSIEYPIYRLSGEPIVIDKVVFVNGLPIDDLRVKKSTLGERRLHTKIKMSKFNQMCWSFSDLIMSLKGQENWFIDRIGNTFKYVKTTSTRMITHKISKVHLMETYCLVVLEDIDSPFLQPRPPRAKYARVIYYKGHPLEIVGFSNEFIKPGSKKV